MTVEFLLIPGRIVLGLTKYDDANQLFDRDGSHARRGSRESLVHENMKTVLAVLSALLLAVLGFFAYGLDQWLGIVAFTYPYLLFCATAALLYWLAWFPILKKRALLVGLSVFAILSANFLLPPPSERILRSVLLRIPPGTNANSIEAIVTEAYDGSGYVLPRIAKEAARIHVSLLSQQSGNCTALIFKTKDGKVVSGEYSAD